MRRADEPESVLARWRYLREQQQTLRQATTAANSAATRGDYRTHSKMLRVAMRASTAIAAAYGVQVRASARAKADDGDDPESIARQFVAQTAKCARASGARTDETSKRNDGVDHGPNE